MRNLFIVRHGRSEFNVKKTTNLNSNLTEFGRKQAANVGRLLGSQPYTLHEHDNFQIYTSPFARCLETTKLISANLGEALYHGITVDSDLSEYLNIEGESVSLACESWKREYPEFDWKCSDLELHPEPNEVFFKRIKRFYDSLNPTTVNIVVSHGLPVLMLTHIATSYDYQIPIWDYSVGNCSITWIQDRRAIWRAREIHHEYERNG